MMKPNWSNVPKGYDWMAQDADGKWFAYTHQPVLPSNCDGRKQWLADSFVGQKWEELNKYYAALVPNPDWRNTMEKRPVRYGVSILESIYGNMLVREAVEEANRQVQDAMMLPFPICPSHFKVLLKGEFIMGGNCPLTKNLTPRERINAKRVFLTEQINQLDKRIADLDEIIASVNWKNATAEIKNKAVQAADSV